MEYKNHSLRKYAVRELTKMTTSNVNQIPTWHWYAIDSYVSLFQKAAQNALHLCGGDIFSPPAKRVSATVTEVHIAQLIHHQHIT